MSNLPKLVRDYIPGVIASSGRKYRAHVADSVELPQRLTEKMTEEVKEFYEEPSLSEAADIYEVFLAMLDHFRLSLNDVILVSEEKRSIRGGFKSGIILDEVYEPEEERNV